LFILPNHFKGEFHVVKDSIRGEDLVERNGEWVFEIPTSGVLKVKNDQPFYLWHAVRFRYADGQAVDCEGLGVKLGSHSTGPNSSEGSTEFDGTTHSWRVK
jgi:hypothetical protein